MGVFQSRAEAEEPSRSKEHGICRIENNPNRTLNCGAEENAFSYLDEHHGVCRRRSEEEWLELILEVDGVAREHIALGCSGSDCFRNFLKNRRSHRKTTSEVLSKK